MRLHILAKDLLERLEFLEPDLKLECELAGFDRRTLIYARKNIKLKGLNSYNDIPKKREIFIRDCRAHSFWKKLPYNQDLVNGLIDKYFMSPFVKTMEDRKTIGANK